MSGDFDEHAEQAMALLTPDDPALPTEGSPMLARCNYWKLLADLRYYATREWVLPESCPAPATHYTCVVTVAGDFGGQSYTNVCGVHEPMVRTLPGWRSSRLRSEVSA